MADNTKCKVSTLAKDLGLQNKELLAVCQELGFADWKHSTAIGPDEFAIIMNHITLSRQTERIADFLNGKAAVRLKTKTDASKKGKEETAADADVKPEDTAKTEAVPAEKSGDIQTEKKPEETKKEGGNVKAAESKPKNDAAQPSDVRKPNADKKEDRNSRFEKKPEFNKNKDKKDKLKEKEKQKLKEKKPVFVSSEDDEKSGVIITEDTQFGKTRTVDTRAGSVDLSKYDDKLDSYDSDDKHGDKNKNVKKTGQPPKNEKNDKNDKGDKKNGKNVKQDKKDPAANIRFAPKLGKADKKKNNIEEQKKQAELEKARKQQLTVSIPDEITVGELAARLKATASEVIKKLMFLGVMANVNQIVDYDTAYLVADEMGAKVNHEVTVTIEEKLFDDSEDVEEKLVPRAPVVVVMGHVDHGKTSILDAIRNTNVTSGEAGGITQAIGAYRVNVGNQPITFLDTPGHEAFTAMRARGAMATDIAILVVAADDGIMPQTIEAINHAKAANLDIVVAINKMDKPGANPDMIKQELTKYDLVPEEWGGDVICVPVSALKNQGIDKLLETVLIVAEMKDLKANPDRKAKGIVIEAKLDKGRGPVATVLVQNGTLHSGDVIIAGTAVGRVRAMKDDAGRNVAAAGPSVPVEIIGLGDVPVAGDEFNAVADEKMARELADKRRQKQREAELSANSKVSLDDLFAQISEGAKELKIVVKADVVGSAEAVKQSLEKLSNSEVKVSVIHSAVGGINEGDVMLASASNAVIIGFNVRPDKNATDAAARNKVDIHTYRIIYECIEEVEAAMKGMLAPVFREEILGHAEVRQTIHVPSVGTIAGCYITDGKITRKGEIRVLRDSVVIFEDKIDSLKRFKDDVKEVASGFECGVGLEKFNDIKVGDVLEVFEMVEQEAK